MVAAPKGLRLFLFPVLDRPYVRGPCFLLLVQLSPGVLKPEVVSSCVLESEGQVVLVWEGLITSKATVCIGSTSEGCTSEAEETGMEVGSTSEGEETSLELGSTCLCVGLVSVTMVSVDISQPHATTSRAWVFEHLVGHA